MSRVLELFEELSKYRRGSGEAIEAYEFLLKFCAKAGAKTQTDKAGNILASIGTPKICLQSHYDMVELGDQPPKLLREGDWLRAKNGTLGADNGIGVALELALIEEGQEGDYLFTNDEEIGLIGANNLGVYPTAKQIINLDAEEEGVVTIGCAGGADYSLNALLAYEPIDDKAFKAYKIAAKDCAGGHSGVDIHRGIPSAIGEVCRYLFNHNARLVSLRGGERLNSIPKNAEAIAFLPIGAEPKNDDHIEIAPIDNPFKAISGSRKILSLLALVPSGVLGFDELYGIASRSCNFALVKTEGDRMELTLFARGASEADLDAIDLQIAALSEIGALALSPLGRYSSWKATKTPLADRLCSLMKEEGLSPKIGAIHAGLECGVLLSKIPHAQCASIGPTIEFPHSFSERVFLPSVDRLYQVVKRALRAGV
jgi:dipeptidase D